MTWSWTRALLAPLAVVAVSLLFACETAPDNEELLNPGAPTDAAFIEITPAVVTIPMAGDSVQLTSVVRDARGRRLDNALVLWESLTPRVAMVTANGTVIGLDRGEAVIRGAHKQLSATSRVGITATPFPQPPVRFSIQPSVDTIPTVGGAVQLRLEAYDEDGQLVSNTPATWFSLDGIVADVAGGRVDGRRKGVARILVTNGPLRDTALVYVEPTVPVDGITIEPRVDTIYEIGDVLPLRAAAVDANGNPIPGETVTLASLDAAVATIDGNAVVTASAQGDARITATHGKKADTAYISVVPLPVAEGVTISPAADTIPKVGDSVTFEVTVVGPSGALLQTKNVKWSSLDPEAVITGPGVVAGRRSGVARIMAKYGSKSDTVLVWIAPAPPAAVPAAVVVTPKADTIDMVGGQKQLVASVVDAQGGAIAGKTVTWSSSDESVASVDASGIVTGLAVGVTKITATHDGLSGSAQIWVFNTVKPMDVDIVPEQDTIPLLGGTATLSASVIGTNGFPIDDGAIWRSLNPDIASVAAEGTLMKSAVVTGHHKGTARIVAASGTLSDTAIVAIAPTVAESESTPSDVRVTPQADTIAAGGTTKLYGSVVDDDGLVMPALNVVWSSLDPARAQVDGSGTVTGVAAGAARVRAAYGTLSDTAHIMVATSLGTPNSIVVSPERDTIPVLGGSIRLAATVKDDSGNLVSGVTVGWTSLDGGIAMVDGSGLVTGKAQGTARVQAAAGTMKDTAWVAVAPATSNSVSWLVSHSPSNPSTTTTVTISANASDPGGIATTTIKVDGSTVKTCAGGTCSHAATYAQGSHSYSALATDAGGTTTAVGAGSFSVSAPWTGSGPNPHSPHWRHMRTSVIDYRIHYQREPERSAEYDWTAARYDHVTGGSRLLDEYKKRNPTIGHSTYDTFWFIPVANAGATENWLAANGYNVEDAYLHQPGMPKTQAYRITAQQFAGRDYWYYNLGDPGFRAWRNHETRSLMAANAQGNYSTTIFYDSNSPSTVRKYVPSVTLEYPSWTEYFEDYHSLLTEQRSLVRGKYLVANHAQYFSKTEEIATAGVLGGVMTEYENTPYGSGVKEWNAIDQLVANGVVVQFGTGVSPGSKDDPRGDMNTGNYNSIKERVLMWEYGSYLMVADPNRMDAVLFEPYGLNWSTPFPEIWLNAYERDIGLAVGRRSVLTTGTDPAGQRYNVFRRDFESGALLLIRPREGATYGELSAVTVTLPGGTWRMVRADGSLGGAVTTVKLRNSEAVLFVR